MIQRVRVGSVVVEVRGDGARVAPVVNDVGRYLFGTHESTANRSDLRLDVEAGGETARSREPIEVIAGFDNGFVLGRDGKSVVLRGEGCHARLDVKSGVGRVRIPAERRDARQHWTECALVLESVLLLLRRCGLFSVHAAALAHGGRGVLLTGPADSGKSTLALRLVQQGWRYLSDDTVLLDAAAEPLAVRGLRAHFSVDPEAETVFAGLEAGREAALLKEEKWALNVEALYPNRRAEVCTPHALVFPRIADVSESRLEPLAKADAFGYLLAQSSLAQVKLDHTERHLAALGRLLGHVSVHRMIAGRDVLDEPERVDALMHSLLDATLPTS